jgi:hypothetical protein
MEEPMKTYHLAIAAAAAGLLVAASSPASATPLAPASPQPLGVEPFDGEIEPVHYRRRSVRRYHRPYYRSAPAIGFGFTTYPYASPYYAPPYYSYPYGYRAYPYGYGYAPTFGFGIHIR